MLALVYFFVMILLGDTIARRFCSFESVYHRFAAGFLTGLLLSSWITYVFALVFTWFDQPLIPANIAFFAVAAGIIYFLRNGLSDRQPGDGMARNLYSRLTGKPNPDKVIISSESRPMGRSIWDAVALAINFGVVCFLMFATLRSSGNKILLTSRHWSDFGPNDGVMQNFVFGHNFPPENTHFAGELIRHHFLFWFQSANLEYLGFGPTFNINILSIFSMLSTLILISVLGEIIFKSRAVGRIASALFFFSGTLSYIQFFRSQDSISSALSALSKMKLFIASGFPYPGEEWAVWTVDVFLQQRHFSSGVGLLVLILIVITGYIVRRSDALNPKPTIISSNEDEVISLPVAPETVPESFSKTAMAFAFCGIIAGLLPLWHSAIFASAFLIFAFFFLFFPARKYLIIFAVVTAIVALPQLLYIRAGTSVVPGYPMYRLGYVVIDPTWWKLVEFLAFSIGFKWILMAVGLICAGWLRVRIFIAATSLMFLTFLVQISPELVANHKFINVWQVIANLFVAFGLWKLWHFKIFKQTILSRILAVSLLAGVVTGGVLDVFPIWNEGTIEVTYKDDPLIDWLQKETRPSDIFLSKKYVSHPILMAGRRLFYGYPLYAWSAGLNTNERDRIYAKLLNEQHPAILTGLLHQYKIAYVAIDDSLRSDKSISFSNEAVFSANFERVYDDPENRYGKLSIYKVPPAPEPAEGSTTAPSSGVTVDYSAPTAFEGGIGKNNAQFASPRGVAIDRSGNIYVADTGNSRIQKFTSEGLFISVIGHAGSGEGELAEPNGIAIAPDDSIYVVDAKNHRLIKFDPNGAFAKEWAGPEGGFFGPRDLVFAPTGEIYILDQGRSRIVRLDPSTDTFTLWGKQGQGEGDFIEPTGIDIGGDRIYVTDTGNMRIQVFSLDGKFIRQWAMPEWTTYPWKFPDVAFDDQTKHIYVTIPATREIREFDADGNRLELLRPLQSDGLDNPSALVITKGKAGKRLIVVNTGNAKLVSIDLHVVASNN